MLKLADSALAGPAFWLGFCLCLPQALIVRRRARRLPPAAGPTDGRSGDGPSVRLIGIGDSIIDGVGVAETHQALTACVAVGWAEATRRRVEWKALGRNGIDAAGTQHRLLTRLEPRPVDCFLVSVGVNDVTRLKSIRQWRADLRGLVEALRDHSPGATILLLAVPPLERFPALPWPLSAVLGLRASMFNRASRTIADGLPNDRFGGMEWVDYQEFGMLKPDDFAADGYHPNSDTCAAIAPRLAARIGDPDSGRNR
ncbi:MAG: SGNH/GDSL hydrolase family protein [Wenzhouxiangellaceae bacterium]